MIARFTYAFLLILLLGAFALPVAAAESTAVNLPGWVGFLMAALALLLPALVLVRLRSRGQL